MTIRKGEPWGNPGKVPEDAVMARSDLEVVRAGAVCTIAGGNLHESLGRPVPRLPGDDCMLLPVDGIKVQVTAGDGTVRLLEAAGEVAVGSWFARSGYLVITNTGHLGPLNLAPRSHPNDGQLDEFELRAAMPLRERVVARRRARTGTHVPHPHIRAARVSDVTITRRGRQRLVVDGVPLRKWSRVRVTVAPDRFLVAV